MSEKTTHEERMEEALLQMENEQPQDPSAAMQVYPANREITTSPKIVNHDRVWEQLRNSHPGLGAVDIEALLEYVHDKPLAEIITQGCPAPDKDRLKEVLAMDYTEAAMLAGSEDALLDYEEEEDG